MSQIEVVFLSSEKELASCAASFTNWPASSFPTIELCPGAQPDLYQNTLLFQECGGFLDIPCCVFVCRFILEEQ